MTDRTEIAFKPANPLGFGCAYVTGGFESRANVRLLHTAFDSGITHFDTAPMYGRGTSEAVLGEAFHDRRDRLTIVTKVGIARPRLSWRTKVLRSVAAPVRRLLPSVSRVAAKTLYATERVPTDFTPEFVTRSIEESLRHLRTDYVDALLLHEVLPHEVTPELLSVLERLRIDGKVRRIGLGTSCEATAAIDAADPDTFEVYQRTWSVLRDDEALFPHKFNIHHRAVVDALEAVSRRLSADAATRRRVAEEIGVDLSVGEELAKVLLGASIAVNPTGVTLFGSRRAERVVAYAAVGEAESYRVKGAALLRILRESAGWGAGEETTARAR